MADRSTGGYDAEQRRGGRPLPQGRPAHPTLKANLVMIGIVLLIVALSAASTLGIG